MSLDLKLLLLPSRTVQPWEVLLERRDGEATVVLGPGRHVVRRRAEHQLVDLRERLDLVPTQEVLTADGVTAKVSAVFRWTVADPVAFTERLRDPVGAVYLAIQLGLRDVLAGQEAEALVRAPRSRLAEGVRDRAATAAAEVGIRLVDVVVKDVVLPGRPAGGVRRARRRPPPRAGAARGGACRDRGPAVPGQRREAARRPPVARAAAAGPGAAARLARRAGPGGAYVVPRGLTAAAGGGGASHRDTLPEGDVPPPLRGSAVVGPRRTVGR